MKKKRKAVLAKNPVASCMADGRGRFFVIYKRNLVARDLTEVRAKSLSSLVSGSGLTEGLRLYAEQWSAART